ncbi:hypothetical protein [Paenarthrobacter nicotinovorans]|uniref:hypothetical protein n=1 Tax=Paenarthrobacter nicotinovorans TaxID=29320 RepID=UPI000A8A3865|nr:hypothetical protein [Paenarthrobacter nicotinovorans]
MAARTEVERITGDGMNKNPYPSGQSPAERAANAFDCLTLPSHLNLERLVKVVEGVRHRPIQVEAAAALNGGSVCGLWLSTDELEVILHAISPSGLHRQQFVLHELGHMVLRHDELVVPADYIEVLFPNLPAGLVSRVLARSSFTDDLEAAAESLADLFAAAIRNSAMEPRSFERVFE